MKRITFLKFATGATVTLYLSHIHCNTKSKSFTKILARPEALQHLCDSGTIREIGKAYQKQTENENDETVLVRVLSTNEQGKSISELADSASIASILRQKIQQDFQQNKVVVVDGWILALTEARQCALFSLTEK